MCELLPIYLTLYYRNSELSICAYDEICDGICLSKVNQLSLQEYVNVCKYVCFMYHINDCKKCSKMVAVADIILRDFICPL